MTLLHCQYCYYFPWDCGLYISVNNRDNTRDLVFNMFIILQIIVTCINAIFYNFYWGLSLKLNTNILKLRTCALVKQAAQNHIKETLEIAIFMMLTSQYICKMWITETLPFSVVNLDICIISKYKTTWSGLINRFVRMMIELITNYMNDFNSDMKCILVFQIGIYQLVQITSWVLALYNNVKIKKKN